MDNTKREQLYQVWAEETNTGQLTPVPFFPRAAREVADRFADDMRAMIMAGKEKRYSSPQVLMHFSTQH